MFRGKRAENLLLANWKMYHKRIVFCSKGPLWSCPCFSGEETEMKLEEKMFTCLYFPLIDVHLFPLELISPE